MYRITLTPETLLATNQGLMTIKDIMYNTNCVKLGSIFKVIKDIKVLGNTIVAINKLGKTPVIVNKYVSGREVVCNRTTEDKALIKSTTYEFGYLTEDLEVAYRLGELMSYGIFNLGHRVVTRRDNYYEKVNSLVVNYISSGNLVYQLYDRDSLSSWVKGFIKNERNNRKVTPNAKYLADILFSLGLDCSYNQTHLTLPNETKNIIEDNLMSVVDSKISYDTLIGSGEVVKEAVELYTLDKSVVIYGISLEGDEVDEQQKQRISNSSY